MNDDLKALAEDLYNEGYMCGIKDGDGWFEAWAMAMRRVCAGEKYHTGLVEECFRMMKGNKQ